MTTRDPPMRGSGHILETPKLAQNGMIGCPEARWRRVRLPPAHVTGCVPAFVRR